MAETYIVGETKVRPGAYFNIQKTGNNAAASIISGVTAVIFKSDFGPLNQAVELNAEDGYADTFGTGGTTDAMQEAINGGAKTIIACRVGNGGKDDLIQREREAFLEYAENHKGIQIGVTAVHTQQNCSYRLRQRYSTRIAATEIRDCISSLIITRTQETESEWTRTEIQECIGWLLSGAAVRRLRAMWTTLGVPTTGVRLLRIVCRSASRFPKSHNQTISGFMPLQPQGSV